MDYTKNLNEMQQKAVLTTDGPLLLIAGAGSGKTRVITHRAAHIISTGVPAFNLLAITFTNKAAREMRERLNGLLPGGADCWVATFHSFCAQILRREIGNIGYTGNFTIYDTDDCKRLMKTLLKEMNLNEKMYQPGSMLSIIGKQKDELIGPDDFAMLAAGSGDYYQEIAAQVYKRYQKRLYMNNALDFDDIICKTVELFITCPDVLEKYRSRFRYIMVDEYQDTNSAQYQLIRLLASLHGNLCVVGDDDQSIYGWRGANIRNILDFEKDFPGAQVIKLEQNYRSAKRILAAANAVIKNNGGRKPKNLWTDQDEGAVLEYHQAQSDIEEADMIAAAIADRVNSGETHKGFAVLYRTNAQSRALENAMIRRKVRHKIFGGVSFYQMREIKDVLAYLRCLVNPADDVSATRIINVPRRGIGSTAIELVANFANQHDMSFFQALGEIESYSTNKTRNKKVLEFCNMLGEFQELAESDSLPALVKAVLDKTGYLAELKQEDTDEKTDRAQNALELINQAAEFEMGGGTGLSAFLEDVALVADIDGHNDSDDVVALMTLHSSKGLEFPIVFLPGFEDGLFPAYRAIADGDSSELEEERRLCYVGITRAKQQLIITSAKRRMQHGEIKNQMPSRFLKEIPKELFGEGKKKTEETIPAKPSVAEKLSRFAPKSGPPDYDVGDAVRQPRYGIGEVVSITHAGADYEVTVDFKGAGVKKMMAGLSKITKIKIVEM